MSGRRTVPSISPNDLRDHADDERIQRIWERIEHNVAGSADAAPRRARSVGVVLLAASLAAFCGGIGVGKLVWHEPSTATIPLVPPSDHATVDVWAAGSQARAYALPGGGEIVLRPGATVELERNDADALTLRLVQGEAHVDAVPRSTGFAVVAGDARLASGAGSVVVVRRGANHMDVEVKNGSVSISAPGGAEQQVPAGHVTEVPLHTVTTSVTPNPIRRDPKAPPTQPDHAAAPAETAVAVAAPATPDWRTHWDKGNSAEALKLLREQPGGIDAAINNAKSANELMTIAYVARDKKGGEPKAVVRALIQVVERFPKDHNAAIAAGDLHRLYEKAAKAGNANARLEADRWAVLAQKFERELIPPGARGTDAQLCSQFHTAHRDGRKDEAAKLAQEYLKQHPNGPCRDDAERIAKGEDLSSDDAAAAESQGDAKSPDKNR